MRAYRRSAAAVALAALTALAVGCGGGASPTTTPTASSATRTGASSAAATPEEEGPNTLPPEDSAAGESPGDEAEGSEEPEDASPAATASPTPTTPPRAIPDTLRIAFVATSWCAPGSADDIMGVAADGAGVTSLSCARGQDTDPAWSPDGTRIAFASDRDGQRDVWVMNADGTDQVRLTDDPAADAHPAWSPDGARVTFESARDTAKNTADLWVMNADGSGQERLLEMPGNEQYPAWSPDGTLIAFSHFGGTGAPGIWTVRADGTRPRLLAGGALHSPAWSPDGRWIALDGEPHGCKFDVYVMASTGARLRQLTDSPRCGDYDKHPSWSPDGKTLVFMSQGRASDRNHDELYTVPFAGGPTTLIVPYRVEKGYSGPHDPDWSPVR